MKFYTVENQRHIRWFGTKKEALSVARLDKEVTWLCEVTAPNLPKKQLALWMTHWMADPICKCLGKVKNGRVSWGVPHWRDEVTDSPGNP
jgi:hypothetical protein